MSRNSNSIHADASGSGQAPEESGRSVATINNRRSERFRGYRHNPKKVISAETLWERFQQKIADASRKSDESRFDIFMKLAGHSSGCATPSSYLRSTYSGAAKGHSSAEVLSQEISRFLDSTSTYHLTKYELRLEMLINLPDHEGLFHERSTSLWAEDLASDEWRELQESLEPSIHDEGVLGDFQTWLSRMPQQQQFLCIGDTNHEDETIQEWINSGSYIQALNECGFKNLVLELPARMQPIIDKFFSNEISLEEFKTQIKSEFKEYPFCMDILSIAPQAKKSGIRIYTFDEMLEEPEGEERHPRYIWRRIQHDEGLARKIKNVVGDGRTAIIYGAAHFNYKTTLIDLLGGIKKCRTINLHGSLADFHDPNISSNATFVAPYALIINEGQVVETTGRYQRDKHPDYDEAVASLHMHRQEKEIKKFMALVNENYPDLSDPALHGVHPDDVLRDVYWHRRAVKTGFSKPPPGCSL